MRTPKELNEGEIRIYTTESSPNVELTPTILRNDVLGLWDYSVSTKEMTNMGNNLFIIYCATLDAFASQNNIFAYAINLHNSRTLFI